MLEELVSPNVTLLYSSPIVLPMLSSSFLHTPAGLPHVQAGGGALLVLQLPLLDTAGVARNADTLIHYSWSRTIWILLSFLITGDAS